LEVKKKITLTPEQQTLLVPLYCKAAKNDLVLSDTKAQSILQELDYDFHNLRIPQKTCTMMRLRAKQFDIYTRKFLSRQPAGTVIHLGCGLDSRYLRVNNGRVKWYDLDMPGVIEVRKIFYNDTDDYHMLDSSVTDTAWINKISQNSSPVLILAEGLFMYLTQLEVKELILKLKQSFPGSRLIFDAFSTLTAGRMKAHPSIHKTGANVQWGIDDPKVIESWDSGIYLEEERYFSQFEDVKKLNMVNRLIYKLTEFIPAARRAHRILYYTL
jgi:O-methyltransferase involved in polyketide biosynthesis